MQAAYIQEINEQKLEVPDIKDEDSQLDDDVSRQCTKTDEESDHPRTNRGSFDDDDDENYRHVIEQTPTRRIKEPLLPKDSND